MATSRWTIVKFCNYLGLSQGRLPGCWVDWDNRETSSVLERWWRVDNCICMSPVIKGANECMPKKPPPPSTADDWGARCSCQGSQLTSSSVKPVPPLLTGWHGSSASFWPSWNQMPSQNFRFWGSPITVIRYYVLSESKVFRQSFLQWNKNEK